MDGRTASQADLGRMMEALSHRGPDGTDIWREGPVAFGHLMFYATPESRQEMLPLVDATDPIVLTADARIDNRAELLDLLDLNGRSGSVSDSELILAAYKEWGEQCPDKLIGVFAFAVWDGRRQTLFCARDHFGVKPFYYAYEPGGLFAFGSEIKALLELEEVSDQLSEARVADFLTLMMEDKVSTSYSEVQRLPAAHTLTVDPEGMETRSYWSLDPSREVHYDTQEEYEEAFREVFEEAVRCRLRSASPVGTHLSGGLDSSSVTCVARDIMAEEDDLPLSTFSNIFEDLPPCDEQPYINAVLEQGGLEPHYLHADRFGPLSDWENASAHEDEVYTGPNHFLVWHLAQTVRESDVRVVLDGFDGDTTVSHGTRYFGELAGEGNWEKFADEARAYGERQERASTRGVLTQLGLPHVDKLRRSGKVAPFLKNLYQVGKHFGIARRALLWEHAVKPLVPEPLKRWSRKLRGLEVPSAGDALPVTQSGLDSVLLVINKDFANRMDVAGRKEALDHAKAPHEVTVREEQCRGLSSGGFTYTLELYDRAAAASSIEIRHPFLDKRLVEFCVALPPEKKLYQGWTRWIMRRALEGTLPEKVGWRAGKASMELSFLRGVRHLDREAFDEILLSDLSDVEEYIDVELVRAAYQRLVSDPKILPRDSNAVWRAVVVTLLLRRARRRDSKPLQANFASVKPLEH